MIEALRARLAQPEAPALDRLRKQTVELVTADVEQHRKLRRFSGQGLTRMRAAVGLIVLAHNLLRLVTEAAKAQAKAGAATVNADMNSTEKLDDLLPRQGSRAEGGARPLAVDLLHLPGEPAGVGHEVYGPTSSRRPASPAGRAGRGRARGLRTQQ